MNDKVLSLLSIAAKSGNIASGEFSVENMVKGKKGYLVIISMDASQNTKKKFYNMCKYYHTPIYEYATKEALGHWIGKEYRVCVCISDAGLANALMKRLESEKLNNGGKS
ncbi:MAG: 50S ribosomal protein L7ae [Eubacterium sp.]|jgi:Ribosomal protein HS6-type (S12/L30/L7a)|nr:50S ribosomal protein L7ae [Eubacterium sp.]